MADGKWHGKVSEVIPAPVEKVWPILSDFGGLQKNFPQIFESCDIVEGENNKIGALRALVAPLPDGSKVQASERLLTIDDVNHTTSYKIEKIVFGWTGYVGGISVKGTESGQTLVDWTFELDPVDGQTEEEMIPHQSGLFQAILNVLKESAAQ